MADLVGNVSEIQYGYRIVNGEIQILENNNAADPLADLSKDSPEWRAILPDSSDEGYTLVDPGTSGTLHWNGSQLGTEVPQDTIQSKIIKFTAITTSSALTKIPCIMYELGLIPIKLNYGPDETDGYCSLAMLGEEMLSSRGGHYTSEDYAGLGSVSTASRNSADVRRGCRPRSL
ncbi:MAG: hypothetical protein Q4B09_05430 [Lachnospiraceae bacterium]|nr:hypothetical protein [Lachnospiraceae bacterium]